MYSPIGQHARHTSVFALLFYSSCSEIANLDHHKNTFKAQKLIIRVNLLLFYCFIIYCCLVTSHVDLEKIKIKNCEKQCTRDHN